MKRAENHRSAPPLTSAQPQVLQRGPALADALAARLREDILAERLIAGDKLPSEHMLSENYGVSRPTVREAIGRLKHDGLVMSRQGSGVFVADPQAATVFRLDVQDFTNQDEVRYIVELLVGVEGTATQLAAERRSEAALLDIRSGLEAVQQAMDRGEPGVEEDLAFHRAIIEATGNPYFRDLSEFLDRKVRRFIRRARQNSARFSGLAQMVQAEHVAIYDAIAASDGPAARLAAERHVNNAAERLRLYVGL